MRRSVTTTLTGVLCLGVLAGCNNDPGSETSGDEPTASASDLPTTTTPSDEVAPAVGKRRIVAPENTSFWDQRPLGGRDSARTRQGSRRGYSTGEQFVTANDGSSPVGVSYRSTA